MDTEPSPPKLNKILRAVEEEENSGVHAIEIDERPELIELTANPIKAFFEYHRGCFYDLVKTDGTFEDVPDGMSFEFAEGKSLSLSLGPEDGKKRKLKYKIQSETKADLIGHTRLINKVIAEMETQSASGQVEDVRELRALDQNTFAVLAGLWAIPLISRQEKHKRIGVLFEGSAIDVQNWKATFEFLHDFSRSNSLSLFLFILQGKVGRNPEVFSTSVNRIGIYSSKAFIPTNSYQKSIGIIRMMADSLKDSVLKIPLVFFIGAGASVEAGFPPTEHLMLEAIRRLLKEDEFGREPEELKASFKKHIVEEHRLISGETESNLQVTFERVMTEELNFCQSISESPTLNRVCAKTKEIAPSISHDCLSKLVKTEFKPIFLTTNYDDLIERSLTAYMPEVIYEDADFDPAKVAQIVKGYIEGDGTKVPVLKFHGTIEDFSSIKASVDHTRALETNKHSFLCSLLNGRLFKGIIPKFDDSAVRAVFIGYGFNDVDISSALHSVWGNEHTVHGFVVNPNPTENSLLFLENASRRNISANYMNNLISVPFSTFASELGKLGN